MYRLLSSPVAIRPIRMTNRNTAKPKRSVIGYSSRIQESDNRPVAVKIQTIMDEYSAKTLTYSDKQVLLKELVKIMMQNDVTNEQIMLCIHFLNEKDVWLN